jgi:CDP-diacylglycerol--glycerol-3-phosphate 3-phosphatidyltransferase
MANLLTIARVALIFFVVWVWSRQHLVAWWWLDVVMVPLLGWAIFMDALDGWVARRRREETDAGALFDIAGDRIVELVLWVFFAIRRDAVDGRPLVAYWVPLVIIVRTVVTDLVRSVAFQKGRTPFGEKTMMESGWAKAIVGSRWSRGLYGALKAVAFCVLGAVLAGQRAGLSGLPMNALRLAGDVLVYGTVLLCLVRAAPVVWDGRRFLIGASAPSSG